MKNKELFSYAILEYCLTDDDLIQECCFATTNDAVKWVMEKIKNNEINRYCITKKTAKTTIDNSIYWSYKIFELRDFNI